MKANFHESFAPCADMNTRIKRCVIIAGGKMEDAFACEVIRQQEPTMLIAADSGMEFLYRNGIKPDVIVGDFDSVSSEALAYFRQQPGICFHELVPEKDDTDTESAIRLAISMGAKEITLLGGTGSRMDHVLGNIELLGIGMNAGIPITMMDANNRIRMIRQGITLRRDEQFGKYVSLFPYTEQVEHLYLRGFKYPLSDYCLRGFCSIGVSNEIQAEEAEIAFDGGILLVIESKD